MEPRIPYAKTEDGVSIAYWTKWEGVTPLACMPSSPVTGGSVAITMSAGRPSSFFISWQLCLHCISAPDNAALDGGQQGGSRARGPRATRGRNVISDRSSRSGFSCGAPSPILPCAASFAIRDQVCDHGPNHLLHLHCGSRRAATDETGTFVCSATCHVTATVGTAADV